MATLEFYIRNETDTEARGPFTLAQLIEQADSGLVKPETMYYDISNEQWTAISANAELKAGIFPEKKKLTLKQAPGPTAQPADRPAPITVDDMLAAAEGRSADTKDKADPLIAMTRCAAIGRWGAIAALLLSAGGELLPSAEVLLSPSAAALLAHPLVFLGAADVLLAILLGLGVVAVYPLIRFRAALGLGFLGFIFWTGGQSLPLLAAAAGSTGLYLCTVFLSYVPVIVSALLAVGGLGFVAWHLFS